MGAKGQAVVAAGSSNSTGPRFRNPCFWALYILCFVDGLDVRLLGAAFRALQEELGFSPFLLGQLAMSQAITTSCFGVCWAIFGKFRPRPPLLALGALAWGVNTILLSFTSSLWAWILLRCLNGVALASLAPLSQSFVADYTASPDRGWYFGIFQFFHQSGVLLCTLVVTSVSRTVYIMPVVGSVFGWRVMFFGVGVASIGVAYHVYRDLSDPVREQLDDRPEISWKLVLDEIKVVRKLFRNKTFLVIMIQGVFGGIPWNALAFLVMYFQYCGLSDPEAGLLVSLFVLACAIGGPLGGWVGDMVAAKSPDHGRTFVAQFSSFSGVPCILFLLLGVPHSGGSHMLLYAHLLLVMGLLCSWCGVATNRPILSEIVPERERASVLAWMLVLEGSSAAVFGAPLVGLLSETVFGYVPVKIGVDIQTLPPEIAAKNLQALTYSLLVCAGFPWMLGSMIYGMLHLTYKHDRLVHPDANLSETEPLAKPKDDSEPPTRTSTILPDSSNPTRCRTTTSSKDLSPSPECLRTVTTID